MDKHIEELLKHFPRLLNSKVLDVGAGKGRFLIALTKRGGQGVGLELNKAYITLANKAAREAGVTIEIKEGVGEQLPFADKSFDVANLSEVLEHVKNPEQVLLELHRVLQERGGAYVSIPNRFGFRDPHYHLYFINWVPRSFAERLIILLKRNKNDGGAAGHQKLSDMHYTTFSGAQRLFAKAGFTSVDIREKKIKERFTFLPAQLVVLAVYAIAKNFYFDSFHFLLTKV